MRCEMHRVTSHSERTAQDMIDLAAGRTMSTTVFAKCLGYLALLLCMSAPGLLFAQQSGLINGSVTDPGGGSVSNAQVTLTRIGQGTVLHVTSNGTGEYAFPALEAGTYSLQVSAPGFEEFEAAGIVLRVSRTERVDAKLTVGSVNTKVEVSGEGLGTVQTESPEISFTITGKQITQLVLNGRNFSQLVTLSPGVINQTGQDEGETGVAGSVSYSINGGRTEYNNWELDGSSLMDNGSNSTLNVYPDVDAIAETQVLTSNYGAQYGRNASGTVLAQTKSGTDHFHGDVFEFLRNDAFNARNYFQTSVPTYKKHDYGFTIGGPVHIPKLYSGGDRKTFFFYSQEWRHENVPGTVFNQQVPSDAERTGNFSDLCYQVPNQNGPGTVLNSDCPVDPTTGQQYPNNQVPIDPNGMALLALIRPPTLALAPIPSIGRPPHSSLRIVRSSSVSIRSSVPSSAASSASSMTRGRLSVIPHLSDQLLPHGAEQFRRSWHRHGCQSYLCGYAIARQ